MSRVLAVAPIGLLGAALMSAASARGSERVFAAMDAAVQRGLDDQRYPGAVLLVGRGGRTLHARAFGRHTYEPDAPPMRLDTVFDMASCSKVVGGTPAALILMEEGKLRLDDPVSRHLPGFDANGKNSVTMRDLLTHVSGLKAYESYAVVEKERRPAETHAQALYRHYASLSLAYPTGTKVLYSCLNLQTAAAAVQTTAQAPLEDILMKRIWGPIGMKDTTYRPTARQMARCAPTWLDADGKPVRGIVHDPLARYHGSDDLCPGNAGLYSTARDLERYVRMILDKGAWRGKRVLQSESVRLMTTVQTPPGITPLRSIGWAVYSEAPYCLPENGADGARVIGHTGYTGTWIWIDIRTRHYIILLTNRVYPSPATNGGEGRSIDGIRAQLARVVLATASVTPSQPVQRRTR